MNIQLKKDVRKIINDPIYGFISINHPLIFTIIEHPYFQRLRRIRQMALASYVFPGATHTRFQHSLGAYHLMSKAIEELQSKGVAISEDEKVATQCAILLHDIGHGPFSHSLEKNLFNKIQHEQVSKSIVEKINKENEGKLDMTKAIFNNTYHRPFFHQLLSSQLDVDRMDYLNRDSYFTGVAEGIIGYDRILKMLNVHNEKLVIEEKGVFSVEKFIIARRLMYIQVYHHKTVWCLEKLLVKFIQRLRYLSTQNSHFSSSNSHLDFFLHNPNVELSDTNLEKFMLLDDDDIMYAVKQSCFSKDKVLQIIAKSILYRNLYKIKASKSKKVNKSFYEGKLQEIIEKKRLSKTDACFLIFSEDFQKTTYDGEHQQIQLWNSKENKFSDIFTSKNTLITVDLPEFISFHFTGYYSINK